MVAEDGVLHVEKDGKKEAYRVGDLIQIPNAPVFVRIIDISKDPESTSFRIMESEGRYEEPMEIQALYPMGVWIHVPEEAGRGSRRGRRTRGRRRRRGASRRRRRGASRRRRRGTKKRR